MLTRNAIAARLRAAGCVFAEDEADLLMSAATSADELEAMVSQRADGFPLEQVVGWADFCGLRIVVRPGVFVPRRRSEFVVAQAIALTKRPRTDSPTSGEEQSAALPTVIVDLCCGTGAIGIAVASSLRAIRANTPELHAVDIDPAAVACTAANMIAATESSDLAGEADHVYRAYQGDLCEPLPARLKGCADLIIANAPYVPSGEIGLLPAEARLHEPLVALDGGPEGVDIHRRIAAVAPSWLAPRGHLIIETSQRQATLTAAAVAASGLATTVVNSEELSATVVIGSLPRNHAGMPASRRT